MCISENVIELVYNCSQIYILFRWLIYPPILIYSPKMLDDLTRSNGPWEMGK